MKKTIYFILPALFLMLGAAKSIDKLATKDADKQTINNLQKVLKSSKELSESKKEKEETNFDTTEISLDQTILIQGKIDEKIQEKIFKLNLPKGKKYLLVNKKTGSTQTTFTTTNEKKVSWDWTQLQGEYFYTISITLDAVNNYILIDTKPKERNEFPGTSLTTFSIIQIGENFYFKGETYGSEVTYAFKRPILSTY